MDRKIVADLRFNVTVCLARAGSVKYAPCSALLGPAAATHLLDGRQGVTALFVSAIRRISLLELPELAVQAEEGVTVRVRREGRVALLSSLS